VLAAIARAAGGPAALVEEIARLRVEVGTLENESHVEYLHRDELRAQIRSAQQELYSRYRQTEAEFVPLFRVLAERFLGVDIDVDAELSDLSLGLVIRLKSQARREVHALSESQRFFLDIALRMALAMYMSSGTSHATLFVDTPEGSLDIAYEARAGEMFSRFVLDGHRLLMTANVNSSQLLLKLAGACGSSQMALVRMTEWSELSQVQLEESTLFVNAYDAIEKALAAGPTHAVLPTGGSS
jgi:ABC-type cobalamin transport system ATPase subunit